MSRLVFSILSPLNYEILSLILPSTGRHNENTILWVNHLFLKWWQPWKNFLTVRNQHRAVLSKASKVILFVGVFIKHLLWLSWFGDFSTWLGKYSSLQHLFNIYPMAGMCSVQEVKANSSSSRILITGLPGNSKSILNFFHDHRFVIFLLRPQQIPPNTFVSNLQETNNMILCPIFQSIEKK